MASLSISSLDHMINVSNEHLDEKQWEFIVEFVNKKSENLEEVPVSSGDDIVLVGVQLD